MVHHLSNDLDGSVDVESLQHLDFHYHLGNTARFRIHVMRTQNNFGLVARIIPVEIPILPLKNGKGRIVALEIMVRNSVIKHFMLDVDRWREIPRAMEEGHALYGSQTFDLHLQKLVEEDLVEYEEALANAVNQEDFAMRLGRE